MRTALLLLWLMILPAVGAETNDFWKSDLESGTKAANENGNPMLLYFHASWCGPCRVMKQTTLKDLSVVDALSNYVRVSLDFDANPELAKQYNIEGIPAFVIVDATGEQIVKTVGFMDAEGFREWLMNGLARTAFADAQRKVFEEKRAEIEQKLKGTDAEQRRWAIDAVLEYSSSHEHFYQAFALEKLKGLAEENPGQLIEALNHPRLATRIHVANALQKKLPADLKFDPWETPENRAKALAVLKASAGKAAGR